LRGQQVQRLQGWQLGFRPRWVTVSAAGAPQV